MAMQLFFNQLSTIIFYFVKLVPGFFFFIIKYRSFDFLCRLDRNRLKVSFTGVISRPREFLPLNNVKFVGFDGDTSVPGNLTP